MCQVGYYRKAKVMRINNGSTPSNLGVGAKTVVNGIGSLSTPNQNVDSIISGNGHGFTHPSSINVVGTSSTPTKVNTDSGGGHGSLPPPSLNAVNRKLTEQM